MSTKNEFLSDHFLSSKYIARLIDHTLLKPDTTVADIEKICSESITYQFASVCISPTYVSQAAKILSGSIIKVCTVVGFPSGAHLTEIKVLETCKAIEDGASEIDMVINIGAMKTGNQRLVYEEIKKICEICRESDVTSKIIIETAFLSEDEKINACLLVKKAGADFVKTSTGFGPHGATLNDVALMSGIVRDSGIGVKAAGGIRSYKEALDMIRAGATRIGTSSGIKIIEQAGYKQV
jgi:deoxyribose-phosphate aldolase